MATDPVWRGSPSVLARHYPAYAAGVALACAAFAVAALTGRPFVDAAEVALLRTQVEAVPESAPAIDRAVVRASMFDPRRTSVEAAIEQRMDALAAGRPPSTVRVPILYQDQVLQPRPYAVNPATGDRLTAVLFSASDALDALVPRSGGTGGGPGLWVPDSVAGPLGLTAGDRMDVQLSFPAEPEPRASAVRVAGVYATDEATGAPQDGTGRWAELADALPPWPSFVSPTTPEVPLLVADEATYRRLARAIGERTLVTWDVAPEAEPLRLADADALVASATALLADIEEPLSDFNRAVHRGPPRELSLVSGLPGIVDAARRGRSEAIEGASAVRVVGIGLSWLVVALSAAAILLRRRGERRVLIDGGRSVPELGLLTVAEVALPVAVGLAAGMLLCGPLVEAVVGEAGLGLRPGDVVLVVVLAVGTFLVASLGDAASQLRGDGARSRLLPRTLPWRSVVVTVAVVGVAQLATDDGRELDTITSAFPLVAIGSVAIALSLAATSVLRRTAARWLPEGLVPRLVLSGLARDSSAAISFLAACTAFGAVAYGLLCQESVSQASEAKVATLVGANSVHEVATSRVIEELPTVRARSTPVWRLTAVLGAAGVSQVMVVDSETLPRAALWSSAVADGRDLAEVLDPLTDAAGGVLPALAVGDPAQIPTTGDMSRGNRWAVPFRVVDRLPSFPGLGQQDAMLVVDRAALFPLIGDADPTLRPASAEDADGDFRTQLWSTAAADAVAEEAKRARIFVELEGSASQARADPVLVARGWTMDYLALFTGLATGLGLMVLAGLHVRDAQARRLQDVTLADLGHRRGVVSRAAGLRLAVVAVLGAAAGGAAAYGVTAVVAPRLDPLPDLAPALSVGGGALTALAALGFVAVALALAYAAGRWAPTGSVNELLHDE